MSAGPSDSKDEFKSSSSGTTVVQDKKSKNSDIIPEEPIGPEDIGIRDSSEENLPVESPGENNQNTQSSQSKYFLFI